MITRFAPSPTGYLHWGHALAAYRAFGFARAGGGTCLLRVEDIDHTRCRDEFTTAIYEDLRWLGFHWPEPVRVQSEHLSDYAAVIEHLRERRLVYPCTKTRSDLPRGPYYNPNPIDAEPDTPFAWRLSMRRAREILGADFVVDYEDNGACVTADPWRFGDIVLARKDIGTSYHIAVTYDDHIQGITDVVRGADFTEQTALHVLLQRLMAWHTPRYHHHALILGTDGRKLSKRRGSVTLRSLRAAGLSPDAVLARALKAVESGAPIG